MSGYQGEESPPIVFLQEREDGGLRVWSDDEPGLVLSHSNAALVLADILPALKVLREERAEAGRAADNIAGRRG